MKTKAKLERTKVKMLFFVIIVVMVMSGCATYGPVPKPEPVIHQYELTFINMDKEPIEGVSIDYTINEITSPSVLDISDSNYKKGIYTTKSNGIFRDSLLVFASRYGEFRSSISCNFSKAGYYSGSTWMDSEFGCKGSGYDNIPVKQDTIVLVRPIDYFDKEFASLVSEIALKDEILRIVDLIKLEGLIANTSLDLHSIDLTTFKNQKYLQYKFSNSNTYNSLQLNKYDIGIILFDEVIRKILNPLNIYISDSESFFGYDLTVKGRTKSFAQKYGGLKYIDYRFLIPKSSVDQYKDKDISGQQLLNESVILMDDERIELELQ